MDSIYQGGKVVYLIPAVESLHLKIQLHQSNVILRTRLQTNQVLNRLTLIQFMFK